MKSAIIDESRIKYLNSNPVLKGQGHYVLYWMQQSQRAEDNHALEYAVELANMHLLPLVVVFCLISNYPEANLRHYRFMLEGLIETQNSLAKRGIQFVVLEGQADRMEVPLAKKAAVMVVDRGYLRHQKVWRNQLAEDVPCRLVQVESDVIVPVEVVSNKAEYAARTIRPKIHRNLKPYLTPVRSLALKVKNKPIRFKGLNISRPDPFLARYKIDSSTSPVTNLYTGGTSVAKQRFSDFIKGRLVRYEQNSNQPQTHDISQMSPYLHFGQVSPVYLALKVIEAKSIPKESRDAFIEQLVVRRELAMNFVQYTPDYDQFSCIPNWAKTTLSDHDRDSREYSYSLKQLESADTHDVYWNAAMKEMMYTGFMHNYMRMYWAKKILEWSPSPQEAYETTLYLNNKYFLDGRDPNSYTGVAWCYGLHDRPWKERAIFGKVRYMAASGLERKCDIAGYVKKVDDMVKKIISG